MIGVEWLTQTAELPLWGVLALGGFQKVTRGVRRQVRRRRRKRSR